MRPKSSFPTAPTKLDVRSHARRLDGLVAPFPTGALVEVPCDHGFPGGREALRAQGQPDEEASDDRHLSHGLSLEFRGRTMGRAREEHR